MNVFFLLNLVQLEDNRLNQFSRPKSIRVNLNSSSNQLMWSTVSEPQSMF